MLFYLVLWPQKYNGEKERKELFEPKNEITPSGAFSEKDETPGCHGMAIKKCYTGDHVCFKSLDGFRFRPHETQLYQDIRETQWPIIYCPEYNIGFLGLEKLHPFDAGKWGNIYNFLKGQHAHA